MSVCVYKKLANRNDKFIRDILGSEQIAQIVEESEGDIFSLNCIQNVSGNYYSLALAQYFISWKNKPWKHPVLALTRHYMWERQLKALHSCFEVVLQERNIESLSCLYFSLGDLTSAALVLPLFPITSCHKTKIMASSPITSWQIDGETVETMADFIWGELQNHCRWWLQPWN